MMGLGWNVQRPVVLFSFVFMCALCTWTTINPVPVGNNNDGTCSTVFGDTFFVANSDFAFLYSISSATWSSLSPMPTVRQGLAGEHISLSQVLVVGGQTSIVEAYLHQLDVWTTRASTPNSRFTPTTGSDGTHMWVAGGTPNPTSSSTLLTEYNADTDGWTVRRPMPTARYASAGGFASGAFLVLNSYIPNISNLMEKYTPETDSWTTVSANPAPHPSPFNAACAYGAFLFSAGGEPALQHFQRYHVPTDQWTTLDSVPTASWGLNMAVGLATGTLVAVFHFPGAQTAHAYHTGLAASIMGDPMFRTFKGEQHHLDLRAGVFNMLTTRAFSIRALVEQLETLPPDENTVMTMIAIQATINEAIVEWHCSVQAEAVSVCSRRSSDPTISTSDFEANLPGQFVVSLPSAVVTIKAVAATGCTVSVGEKRWYPLASYLDLLVLRLCDDEPSAPSGLLAHLDSKGVAAVRVSLEEYELSELVPF